MMHVPLDSRSESSAALSFMVSQSDSLGRVVEVVDVVVEVESVEVVGVVNLTSPVFVFPWFSPNFFNII